MKKLIDVVNERNLDVSLFKIKDLLDKDTLCTFVKKYHKEQDAQIPLAKILQQAFTVIRETEVPALCKLQDRGDEDYWRVDYVLEIDKDSYKGVIPLEFKYNESSVEVKNDLKKLYAYVKDFEDVCISGLLLIYTDKYDLEDICEENSTMIFNKKVLYDAEDLCVVLIYVKDTDVRLMSKNPMQLSQIVSTRKKKHFDDPNIVFTKI